MPHQIRQHKAIHDNVSLVHGKKETNRTDHQNRLTHTWKHYWGKRFNNGTDRQLKVERQTYQGKNNVIFITLRQQNILKIINLIALKDFVY